MKKEVVARALRHLRKDARLKGFIDRHEKPEFDRGQKGLKAHSALVRAIIFQQLSGKAARTILERFLALYPKGRYPTPEEVLETSESRIRGAGISGQKAGYLKDLSEKFLDGTINPRKFSRMSDMHVREHVVAVKGVGPWTADMFLMFTLHRMDVLPTGDLGIQKGMQKLFKLRSLPDPTKMEKLAQNWAPYRTVACWYLWRLADENNPNR